MIKGAYAPAKGILVTEGETSWDPFLMNARAVGNTLRKVWGPLEKLETALAETGNAKPRSLGDVGAAPAVDLGP